MFPFPPAPSPVPIIINMPSSGSPAWLVPVIAGFFLVVGACIALLSTFLSDRRKFGDENIRVAAANQRRWDEQIRQNAAEFLEAMDNQAEVLEKLPKGESARNDIDMNGESDNKYGPEYEALHQELLTATQKSKRARNLLSFVAPKVLTDAALKLESEMISARFYNSIGKDETIKKIRQARRNVVNQVQISIHGPEARSLSKATK